MKTVLKISSFIILFFLAGKPALHAQVVTDTVTIKTNAQCGECKDRLEENISVMKGVKSATLDMNTKIMTIVFVPGKTDSAKLHAAIAKIGYDADDVKADPKAQGKLPKCCQPPTQ